MTFRTFLFTASILGCLGILAGGLLFNNIREERDTVREGIQLLLEDHLEQFKPDRYRSCSIYNHGIGLVAADVPIPMYCELLDDNGEWYWVSEKEFDAFLDSEQLKVQAQIAAMEQVITKLEGYADSESILPE